MYRFALILLIQFLIGVKPSLAEVVSATGGDKCINIDINTDVKRVRSMISGFLKQQHISGAAVVIYDHGQMKQYVFGYSNLKNKTPVTSNTLFELGSITKSFTGLLLAREVNQGKIYLDDTLHGNTMQNITLLELATHTSGLPAKIEGLPYNARNLPKYKTRLQQFTDSWKSSSSVGTEFVYSNIGFSLLGQEIAYRVKYPYITLIQEDILNPLEMQHTYFTVPNTMYPVYAKGYTATGALARSPSAGLIPASWALKSSIEDMAKYLQAAVGDPNTPNEILKAMQVAQTPYVQILNNLNQEGLGWSIVPLENLDKLLDITREKTQPPIKVVVIDNPKFNKHALIEKTGATDGFRSYIAVIPEREVGIVILTNRFTPSHDDLPNMGRKLLTSLHKK